MALLQTLMSIQFHFQLHTVCPYYKKKKIQTVEENLPLWKMAIKLFCNLSILSPQVFLNNYRCCKLNDMASHIKSEIPMGLHYKARNKFI